MSGPNTNYDPVEVSALDPANVDAAVQEALSAIAAAATLDDLKAVRIAHQGEKSPLALANREIGALPPSAKAEAGKRVGQARGRVGQALDARQAELEAERDERILVEERVDVTVPALRRQPGARHPIELVAQRLVDAFVGRRWATSSIGWRAPGWRRSAGTVTSTRSSTRMRSSRSTSSSAWRVVERLATRPRAWPTRLPASALALGGRAPISRLARASGLFSPWCAMRTALRSSRVAAAAIAESASCTAASTFAGSSAETSTGS